MTAAITPLIERMLEPGFYPHGVTEPIQLIQTHISYVLLTGEYAYKIKKPVNFGFLDFTELEQRHHFCLEELRLNQRGAPQLYLEVLPINQQQGAWHLGGSGETVEYTLKMRQFPTAALLSNMFVQGELTPELLQTLARVVAQYHAGAETSDYIQSFGQVDRIRQSFDENYAQTISYIGGPQTQEQFDLTQAYSDRFFQERANLFEQRRQNGWIRACHGDLHLGNICYWQQQMLLFDCIEFNEPFRFVDTMYDVGFMVMDLIARDRPDLANIFLNTYIEQTGDWEGLQLLPLYVSRQAYVRAKVTSFLLNDPGIAEDVKQKARETAAGYYQLAWQSTQTQSGQILIMSGLSGSGKSTVARLLAQKIGAIHIRSDAVRKHLAGIGLDQRGTTDGAFGSGIYTPEMTQKTYDRLLELALLLAGQGFSIILDAKYDRQAHRQAVIDQAKSQQLGLKIVQCTTAIEQLRDRLQARQGDIADATADLLPEQLKAYEELTAAEQAYEFRIDTSQALMPQIQPLLR
jgi:uncharacterized protein